MSGGVRGAPGWKSIKRWYTQERKKAVIFTSAGGITIPSLLCITTPHTFFPSRLISFVVD
ncbi:MAG: hypothetical protein A3G87_06360 [Omnitrophica bacterium RIFCSPLOWO2_12_FULL_50_11]|nr:MAG: hypothetical protein A3G87_06360 [Omnitrophica bacterium RIFCSPLOWO2_12_FULL_50_11]